MYLHDFLKFRLIKVSLCSFPLKEIIIASATCNMPINHICLLSETLVLEIFYQKYSLHALRGT